ncbi:hypothetical protein B5P44_01205 [Mycobacterium sp. CBMA 213]|uniref:Uncharacterized protein n=1 Tax=Mycolicibacterium sp. CBMA 213 TaxID=1968788 RepID=A0A343VRN5_9MYCO|nr:MULTISPECIES: hypothetical protein [unclassified Mycolicibacterium]AVN58559.1 hypothetical protein B5P44_p00264 [Mycolicibacterium sp. CBMA 213]MUL61201.1 hypothetical protein [Mycolicibacterium sp. CBMA 335]MUM03438.1 hypothetical protein [Mycolicibacterium sp. CBMA 213]
MGSNDTADGVLAPVSCPGVTEVVQTQLQTATLIDTGKASLGAVDRWVVSRPRITVEQAAEALEALGRAWGFDDGSPNNVPLATTRLWAARWGSGNRRLERSTDYSAVLATYWFVEGLDAVAGRRMQDAAFAATALALTPVPR